MGAGLKPRPQVARYSIVRMPVRSDSEFLAHCAGNTEGRILLLHGLWMPRVTMQWHARRLRAAGYRPQLFGYATIAGGPDAALPALAEALRQPADILAHSLGGVLAVHALQQYPQLPVRRVVCLGSSLCGSAASQGLGEWRIGNRLLGRSAGLLDGGCKPWRGKAEIGMIAGNAAHGLGQLFGRFDGDSDGTVAVAETRLEGLADHIVVPASHSGLLLSRMAAAQALHFLRRGRFRHPPDSTGTAA